MFNCVFDSTDAVQSLRELRAMSDSYTTVVDYSRVQEKMRERDNR